MREKIETPKAAQDVVSEHYAFLYNNKLESSDSPNQTRADVNRAVMQKLRSGLVPARVLDVGSGPQLLERQLLQSFAKKEDAELLNQTLFVTVDRADIIRQALKGEKYPNVSHVRTSAEQLPFQENSFGMLVSNMAIDMAPRAAFAEAARALVPGGSFCFTLHHPEMMRRIREESKEERVKMFVEYAEKEGMYFKSPDEIQAVLGQYGLTVREVVDRKDMWPETSRWWFVTGTKEAKKQE